MHAALVLAALAPTLPPVAAQEPAAQEAAARQGVDQAELERVTDEIRAEIEGLRGQAFPAPVAVDVADADAFRAYVMQRMEAFSPPEELAAEAELAALIGLLPPGFALVEEMLELLEAQVGGFYDPAEDRFYLMEGFEGDLARVILAHELTHALDDQLFDIDAGLQAREGSSDAEWAYLALVEGSGTAVMNAWTMRHMAELDLEAMMELGSMGMDELAEAPPYLWKPLVGAYVQGERFLRKAPRPSGDAEEGEPEAGAYGAGASEADLPKLAAAVRRAFADPPRSSEQILHPEAYWGEERDDPVPVELVGERLPEGWDVLREDTLGELGLALLVEPPAKRKGVGGMLALQMAQYTSRAARGWGGDRLVLLGKDGARLLHLATAWDTEDDAEEFEAALADLRPHLEEAAAAQAAALAGEGEPGSARVAIERRGDRVHLTVGHGAPDALYEAAGSWTR